MNLRKKLTMLTLIVAVTLTLGISTFGNDSLIEIKGYINENLKISLDGEILEFENVNGDKVSPILVDGTTYLPVRAMSELVNLNVDWDGATQTVVLDTGIGEWSFNENLKPTGKFADIHPTSDYIKTYYETMNSDEEMLKIEIFGIKDGKALSETVYLLVKKDMLDDLNFEIGDSSIKDLGCELENSYEGNTKATLLSKIVSSNGTTRDYEYSYQLAPADSMPMGIGRINHVKNFKVYYSNGKEY